MPRRSSFSAALAALAIPVLMTGVLTAPAHADPGSGPSDDPAAQTQVRKERQRAEPRKPVVSRKARRARADDDAPLSLTIDQLTPSTIPDKGMVRVSGTVTNNDTETWSTINIRPFISQTPLTNPAQLEEAADLPADAVVGDR